MLGSVSGIYAALKTLSWDLFADTVVSVAVKAIRKARTFEIDFDFLIIFEFCGAGLYLN